MKIISGGLLSKKGITITCGKCGCKYRLEDKHDFSLFIQQVYNIHTDKLTSAVNYSCFCPECNKKEYLGIEILGSLIAEREDWKERYKVSIEEALKLGAEDYRNYNR